MTDTYHEIDPSGDVILVLSAQRRVPVNNSPLEQTTQAKPAPSTSPASAEADNNASIKKDAGEKPSDSKETASAANESPRTRYKVSSKHLTLASEYFSKRLKKSIPSTSTTEEPWHHEVAMLDCAPEAFLIVMNIIHGKGRQIPDEVDAAMLLKVTSVVHYLECLMACTFCLGVWIKRLVDEDKIVFDTWDTCLKWAYISWASRRPALFKSSTSAAMSQRCSSSEYPPDLKLPETVKDDITKGWKSALEKAKSVLSAETTRLKGETVYCHFSCDSLHLGAIIKATSHMDRSPLRSIHESLQARTTHCTGGKPRCVNAASFLTLKSALAKACTGEGLALQHYPLND